jgi:hypothetical protein
LSAVSERADKTVEIYQKNWAIVLKTGLRFEHLISSAALPNGFRQLELVIAGPVDPRNIQPMTWNILKYSEASS